MSYFRRLAVALFQCLIFSSACVAAPITVTDVTGRSVTLPKPAERVVLAQARNFPILALLHPDPAGVLAGWSDEFRTSFSNDYANYVEKFPALAKVPVVGRHTVDTFSVEKTLALRPDLVVLTLTFAGITSNESARESQLIKRFEDAGVPVIVIDFFVHPMTNTVPSLTALGNALGRDQQTADFIAFYQQHMDQVADRLRDLPEAQRLPVFVHAHAGTTDCCNSPGTGTFNEMITYAGGHNIGSDVLKSATGRLSFEYINTQNPKVYVATGTGGGRRASSGLVIGAGSTNEEARASLKRIIDGNKLNALAAAQEGNAHGIWHAFNDSPLHVVFIEALASWIHPERFKGISPKATLDYINENFLAVPMQGTYMIDLDAK